MKRRELVERSGLCRVANFGYEVARSRRRLGIELKDVPVLLRRYDKWSESVRNRRNAMQLGIPWMVYDSIDFLRSLVSPGCRVFEYGSGGSTVFLAALGAVGVSVEHDVTWAEAVSHELTVRSLKPRWDIMTVPATPRASAADEGFTSMSPHYAGLAFTTYVRAVESYPERHFDVIVIDGRARNACMRHAAPHVRPGGVLLVDNTERKEYWPQLGAMVRQGWSMQTFRGPLPTSLAFGSTTALVRPG